MEEKDVGTRREEKRPMLRKKEKRHRCLPLHRWKGIHPRQRKIPQHSRARLHETEGERAHPLARWKQVQGPQPPRPRERRWTHISGLGHPSSHRQEHPRLPRKFSDEATKRELKDLLLQYDKGLLVADPRRCEPKKFGGKGARARFQKSYR